MELINKDTPQVKEFISSQKNFNAMIEEKLLKIDELARNIDIISHGFMLLMLNHIDT